MMSLTQFCLIVGLLTLPILLRGQTNEFSSSIKENLGATVNDENDQILPVFSPNGRTLYFSQLLPNTGKYEIWFCTYDNATQQWSKKQRHPDLNPNTDGGKYVFNVLDDGTMLVSGQFTQQPNGSLVQTKGLSLYDPTLKKWQTMSIPSLEERARGRFLNAFYDPMTQVILLSFSENDKKDIFVCLPKVAVPAGKLNYNWKEPMRLPSPINSISDETTPFLAVDGKTLYFSSNRQGGFGADDVYRAKRLDDTWLRWSEVENLGFGVNSNKADIYFTLSPSSDIAYFVSYKHSLGSGDIFQLAVKPPTPPPVVPPTEPQKTEYAPNNLPIKTPIPPPVVPPTELKETEYAPNNLAFLIDISASMETPNKIPLLKNSLKRLVKELRAVDKLTILTFADTALVRYSGRSLANKDSLLQLLDNLQAGGNTRANEGLRLAYEQAQREFIQGGNNEILLATDGRFKLNPEDMQLIRNNPNIILSIVAFGNEERAIDSLKKLAKDTRGSFIHILLRDATAEDALLDEVKKRSKY